MKGGSRHGVALSQRAMTTQSGTGDPENSEQAVRSGDAVCTGGDVTDKSLSLKVGLNKLTFQTFSVPRWLLHTTEAPRASRRYTPWKWWQKWLLGKYTRKGLTRWRCM